MIQTKYFYKGYKVRAPKAETVEPLFSTREVDALAQRIFEERWQGEKSWHGRKTNRTYYRRLAIVEMNRRAKQQG